MQDFKFNILGHTSRRHCLFSFNYFQEIPVNKDVSFDNLKEQYLQVVEFANKYHQVDLFHPLDLWSVLYKNVHSRFTIFKCYCITLFSITWRILKQTGKANKLKRKLRISFSVLKLKSVNFWSLLKHFVSK